MKTACFLFAFASIITAQTSPQVTSKLGRKFNSLPDAKNAVAEAKKNLAADPKNPALILKTAQAPKALGVAPRSTQNEPPQPTFYLTLVRFFQRKMTEAEAVPPEPPADNADQEGELPFDTVAYGIGNWYLNNGNPAKAKEY